MRCSLLALILLAGGAQAQPSRTFVVDGFTNADVVSSFEMEGISLETPMSEIRGILLGRGYEEVFSNKPGYLEFVRGSRRLTGLGATSLTIKIQQRDGGRTIHLSRIVRGEKPFAGDIHVEEARRLKALICEGMADDTQRWQLCPPNTDSAVALTAGRRETELTSDLLVHALRVSTKGSAIHLERR